MTQVATLNQLFDEKTFSWTLAMEDLEMVLPGGVQVSTLEPTRAKDGRITLHLRVVGARDKALELVVNLERSKHFLMPRIVGESAESTEGPGKHLEPVSPSNRIDLDLLADYNPAPPQESKHTEHRSAEKPEKTTAPATGSRGSNPARARHVAPPASGPLTGQSRPPLTGKPQSTPPKPSQPKSGPLQPMRMQPRGPMAPPNPTPGGPR
jgi:type IV pilus assembly protein PilN